MDTALVCHSNMLSYSQDPSIIHIMTTMKKSPSSEKRRHRHRGAFAVALCVFLSTMSVMLCDITFIQTTIAPYQSHLIHRYTTLMNMENASPSSLQAVNHSIAVVTRAHHNNTTTPFSLKKPNKKKLKLDFLIAAFPKCGTTTLVHAFAEHNETDVLVKEQCHIGGAILAAGPAHAAIAKAVNQLSPSSIRGIKCPISLRSHRTLSALARHSPHAKLIVGVRHPVRFLESHYNYRITELHDKGRQTQHVPPIESLVNGSEWMGVSSKNARFEIALMQLGKTNMTTAEIQKMGLMAHAAVVPNKFQVFLYALEQLQDSNKTHQASFRRSLQTFLHLQQPMKPLGHENLNKFVGKHAHKETINVCEKKYKDLRMELVSKGRETQLWLRNQFLKSPDVVVANRLHFLKLIETWSKDPCEETKTTSSQPKKKL